MPDIRLATTPGKIHWGMLCRALTSLTWLLALSLSLLTARSEEPRAKSIQELRTFFQQHCARCHGLDGSARAPDGKRLGGLDFTKAALEFRNLSGPASEREIRKMSRTIQKGILFGYTMPAWKDQLSQKDAALMVREILLKAEAGKVITAEAEMPRP